MAQARSRRLHPVVRDFTKLIALGSTVCRGYVKPLGHTEEIPFQITRTPSGYLPVYAPAQPNSSTTRSSLFAPRRYRDYRNQRNRILTELRKYTGDVKVPQLRLRPPQ